VPYRYSGGIPAPTRRLSRLGAPLAVAAVVALLALGYWAAGMPLAGRMGLSRALAANAPYQLATRITQTQGFVKQAAWLDSDYFLSLLISPEGAAVWRTSYSTLERDKFISSSFIDEHICPARYATRLDWTLSPGKRYMFFSWFTDDGQRQWVLLDISAAPQFKLRKFEPPAGMQISRVLFSPDDRYAVFVHDALKEGSSASLLVMDLAAGQEYWRIDSQQLGFVSELWWGGAIFDAPRFHATASLFNGQFSTAPVEISGDLTARSLAQDSSAPGLLFGAEALWGSVSCRSGGEGRDGPFYISVNIPGKLDGQQIGLTAQPVSVLLLPEPGLLLIANTADFVTNQLWLIDVLTAEKYEIDEDCAGYSVSADGKLLVRSGSSNELRVYEPLSRESRPPAD
jgi:hypothetical protein